MPRTPRTDREMAASWSPFGIGLTKPKHFREMARVAWDNRDNLRYAWRVLNDGVCDGCALGTSGLKDWTVEGTHLCMVRLELLRLNTMGALDPALLADADALAKRSSKDLRALGRLPYPMRRRRGEKGFTRIAWQELWEQAGRRWRACPPARTAMFVTSRGVTNETYYVAQKVMRFLGSPHVDNSARLCHSPSTAGMKSTIGVAASTCSYKDWFDAEVIIFLGSNPANDQPVATKYLLEAKRRGARVLMVNAYREPGMERYWVPSAPVSALFGTRFTDREFRVKVGGDLAFLNAAMKILIGRGAWQQEFVAAATTGFEELREQLARQDLDALCAIAGLARAEIEAFADEIARADRGVLVWSMGVTQHAHGAETVAAIVNLGMMKEWVGRAGCGLMPIRGHSGVQGGAEMGAYSTALPGGLSVTPENARRFSALWGFPVPGQPGMTTVDQLEAAHRGELDAFYCIGGNFLETMPEPGRMAEALGRIPLRLHADIVVSSQMLVEPAEVAYLLPSRTRYEQSGGGTETSTERRVIYSPHVPGHDVGEARSEWEMLLDLARAVRPESAAALGCADGPSIRRDIVRAVPFYAGIEKLSKKGDQFQWGGPHLCAGRAFPTNDGKAHFQPARPPQLDAPPPPPGTFLLATRRGKQFNSMIQRERDPLTGADRDAVFIHPEDAAGLGLRAGQPVLVRSGIGAMRARVFLADVARGTLQAHWPEANALIVHGVVDAGGGVPDYNARVTLEPAAGL